MYDPLQNVVASALDESSGVPPIMPGDITGIKSQIDAAIAQATQIQHTAQKVNSFLSADITKNIGPLFVALAFIAIGGMMLAFSWGDRIADVMEKTAALGAV